jgi:tetratricopeptide (TPR) repeat protein
MVYQARGDYPAALEYYRRSLEIKEQLGNRVGVAQSLHQIGMVHQSRGDYPAALEHYRRSLEIAEQLGDRAGVANSLGQIGRLYQDLQQWDKAMEYIQRAAQEFAAIGDPVGLMTALRVSGLLSVELDDAEGVAQYFAQALHLALQVDPHPALETVARMKDAAEQLFAAGQVEVVAGMAAAGLQVVETLLDKFQGEKQQVAALCGAVLQVIGLAATGERQQALEQAQQVDDATEGMFGLVEWMGQLPGAVSQT